MKPPEVTIVEWLIILIAIIIFLLSDIRQRRAKNFLIKMSSDAYSSSRNLELKRKILDKVNYDDVLDSRKKIKPESFWSREDLEILNS